MVLVQFFPADAIVAVQVDLVEGRHLVPPLLLTLGGAFAIFHLHVHGIELFPRQLAVLVRVHLGEGRSLARLAHGPAFGGALRHAFRPEGIELGFADETVPVRVHLVEGRAVLGLRQSGQREGQGQGKGGQGMNQQGSESVFHGKVPPVDVDSISRRTGSRADL